MLGEVILNDIYYKGAAADVNLWCHKNYLKNGLAQILKLVIWKKL